MASLSSELALVQRYLEFSRRYETRPVIARRNTLPSFSRFLTSKDREIRKHIVEAVYLLAQHPENVVLLAEDQPIIDGVFHNYREGQYDDPELHELSSQVLDLLSPAIPNGDPRRLEVLRRAAEDGALAQATGRSSTASAARLSEAREGFDDSEQSCSQRGSVVGRAMRNESSHVVTFDIPALNARTDTSEIEALLHSTRGVVSYTFAAQMHQLRVFMSSAALKPFQASLTDAGYANLIVCDERVKTNEYGADTNRCSYYDEENERPTYLQSAKNFASSLFSSVIVYSRNQESSLAARVQRQKEMEEKATNRTADRLAKALAQWW